MKWFRTYGDMPDDPKIGTLNDAEFRTWVELLCLACRDEKNGETSATKQTVNWLLRRDVTVTLDVLIERHLIHENKAGFICITKWELRQISKDGSAARMRKLREKRKSDGPCDVTVTKSDAPEKRREEERRVEKKESKNRGSRFALQYPPNDWFLFCQTQRPDLDAGKTFDLFRDYWIAKPGKEGVKLDWTATWRNWVRNQKSQNGGSTYVKPTKLDLIANGIAEARAKREQREQEQAR